MYYVLLSVVAWVRGVGTKYPLFIIYSSGMGWGVRPQIPPCPLISSGERGGGLYEEATAQMIGFQRLFLIDDNRTDQQLHGIRWRRPGKYESGLWDRMDGRWRYLCPSTFRFCVVLTLRTINGRR